MNRTRSVRNEARLALACSIVSLASSACGESNSRPEVPSVKPPVTAPKPASPAPSTPSARPSGAAQPPIVLATSKGDVKVYPIHHGTLRLEIDGKQVWVDPFSEGQVGSEPKADLVLVTDIHPDHLDPAALAVVRKPGTRLVVPEAVAENLGSDAAITVVKNGETIQALGISITAVPMYNVKRGPKPGAVFHDKGRGNGYVLGFGGKRVYISGDTECTDEMKALADVDLAFVCMNLPYTMPPVEAAACVKAYKPKVVVPYHYRGSDLAEFEAALAGVAGVEVKRVDFYANPAPKK